MYILPTLVGERSVPAGKDMAPPAGIVVPKKDATSATTVPCANWFAGTACQSLGISVACAVTFFLSQHLLWKPPWSF